MSRHRGFPQLRQLSIQKQGFDTESLRPISKQPLSLLKLAVALGELRAAQQCGAMPKILEHIFGKKRKRADDEGDVSETSASDGVGPLEFPGDCEGNASGTDLVFVHGLRGSRLRTWSSGDVFWPRDFLKDDVKSARVITWGYDASVANAFTYASNESIFGHAETLLSDLARLRGGIVCLLFCAY